MRDAEQHTPEERASKHAKHAAGSIETTNMSPVDTETSSMPRNGSAIPLTVPSTQESKKKISTKQILMAVGIVFVVLVAAYVAGVIFFSSHFFPNTTLNDRDFSFDAADTMISEIQNEADDYSLTIEGQGFSYTFETGQTEITIDPDQIAEDVLTQQNAALWPVEIFKSHDVSGLVVATFNEEGFQETLTEQVAAFNEGQTASRNASIVYDENTDSFALEEEVYGSQLDTDMVIALASQAVQSLKTTCELTEDCVIQPTVLVEDSETQQALEDAEEMFPSDVSLMLDGSVEAATIDKATLAEWIYISSSDYSIQLDEDDLTAWVDDVASGLNTVGTTRTWTREDGKTCTVSGGTWGWEVDTSSLSTTVYDTLMEGGASSIDIPCTQTGDVYNGAGSRDWGAYVDVDLTQQKARYYDASGNLLYSCDIVSGLPTDDRSTPTGVYYLNAKESPSTLVGYNDDGTIDYETPVSYWMPFIGNSVGLHDATWQSSFGGTYYKTNGSHGCINLPLSAAKWFYNNLSTGVCVITHY